MKGRHDEAIFLQLFKGQPVVPEEVDNTTWNTVSLFILFWFVYRIFSRVFGILKRDTT